MNNKISDKILNSIENKINDTKFVEEGGGFEES